MRMRHATIVAGLALAPLAAALPASAQTPSMGALNPAAGGFQPIVKPDATSSKPVAQTPSALPGANPGRGAAPADKSVADLPPNESLFDAINRGDIGQAHDAINRGATLDAENVLGMTPLELSVDLSRNDITFFLLSLRGASAGAISAKAAALAAGKPSSGEPAVKLSKTAQKAPAPKPAAPPLAKAQLFAVSTDPGQPDPQSGFLGFGRATP